MVKKCKICDEEFEAKRSTSFCSKDHYMPCLNCGKEFFVKKISNPKKFCSISCSSQYRNKNNVKILTCLLCGKEFKSSNNNSKYCSDVHYKNCENCRKSFKIDNPYKQKDYCSRSCSMRVSDKKPGSNSVKTLKNCELCGSEFYGNKNSRFCLNQHYKNCENCGKSFAIKNNDRPAKSCSKKCSDVLTKKNKGKIEKICEWKNCQKKFYTDRITTRFCSDEHFDNCVNCGKKFKVINLRKPSSTCSKKCAAAITDFKKRNSKTVKTTMKKYGVENVSQVPEFKEKKIISTMNNYGVANPSYNEEIKKKRTKTINEIYGVDNVFQSEEVKEKIKNTNIKKYGAENPGQNNKIKEKIKKRNLELYGVENIFMLPEVREKAVKNNGYTISKVNLQWQKLLKDEFNVDFKTEVPFGNNFSADLGYGNILIDINPSFTHSSTISFPHLTGRCLIENCQKKNHLPKNPNYHQKRAIEAQKNGYILLQFFDWMDKEKFLNIVKTKLKLNNRRIFAKDTIIKEISQKEANKFFKENHLFGGSNKQEFCIGLFYKEELVHCHSYGPSRFNKNYEWEAIRSATKQNTYIPGGFSKLDKYFFNKIKPKSVISYVDLSFSSGNTELMFDNWKILKINKPSSTWVNLYNNDNPVFIKSSSARRISADRLLGFEVGEKYPRFDKDGKKITNDFVLKNEGYIEVFDAGTKTIIWEG